MRNRWRAKATTAISRRPGERECEDMARLMHPESNYAVTGTFYDTRVFDVPPRVEANGGAASSRSPGVNNW
jgi:hypothetical protein